MKKEFTAEAGKALNRAAKYAAKMGQYVVGSEHLLYGLGNAPGVASRVLKENGLGKDALDFEIKNYCGISDTALLDNGGSESSPLLETLLEKSEEEAEKAGMEKIGTEHMLLAILKDMSCVAYKVLLAAAANIQKIYMDVEIGRAHV